MTQEFNSFYQKKIHIRIQQRNSNKCFTIIEGLPSDIDLKKLSKHLAKTNQCSCSILNDDTFGNVLQLTGNKKDSVKEFLLKEKICILENLIIH
jgi:translation initiation factor 1